MSEDRDKFLTDAMGECWHEWKNLGDGCQIGDDISPPSWTDDFKCLRCDCKSYAGKPCTPAQSDYDFSTWTGFGKLWEWARDQEWWEEFRHIWDDRVYGIIHPDTFADIVYGFLKERQP
jgi:hypothetical protein